MAEESSPTRQAAVTSRPVPLGRVRRLDDARSEVARLAQPLGRAGAHRRHRETGPSAVGGGMRSPRASARVEAGSREDDAAGGYQEEGVVPGPGEESEDPEGDTDHAEWNKEPGVHHTSVVVD